MSTTSILLGPPGTGKTTTLLNLVDDRLKAGVAPYKLGFVSFTKKATEEAVSRACAKFKREAKEFPYFRTLHSLCFRQLGVSTSLLMKREHFTELGHRLGLEFSHKNAEEEEELARGDRLLFLEGLARLRCVPLKEQWEAVGEEVSWWELDQLARALEEYKRHQGLLDFTDMLSAFLERGPVPELDTLFVDEAQDLSQLQWRVVQKLASRADRVVIAGDDDQAIFRWSGADVDHFLDLKGETRVLNQSYRLGPAVHALAHEIIGRLEKRRPKEFQPTQREATVSHTVSTDDLPLESGQWLLLTRHGYQLKALERNCLANGFDYAVRERGPRTWHSIKVARTWELLRKGQALGHEHVREVLKSLVERVDPRRVEPGDWTLAQLRERLGLQETRIWHEALRVAPDEREYLIAALRRGESFVKPPRIRLSTIHGAKGGEAENVAVFTDLSERTFRAMQETEDDERRVFYVGVTRALTNLHVMSPQTSRSFDL